MLNDVYSDQAACLAQGNAQVAPIDARILNLQQTWKPSGYYEPSALKQAVAAVQDAMSAAFDMLSQAKTTCDAAPGCEFPGWQDDYTKLYGLVSQAQDYVDAANQAESSAAALVKTPYVVATSLKKWALDALSAASNAIVDASMVGCLMPWWASAISGAIQKLAAAGDVLASIAGAAASIVKAAAKTGDALLTTAKESFDLINWAATHVPFLVGGVVLFFAGRYAWRQRHRIRDRFQRSEHALPPGPF